MKYVPATDEQIAEMLQRAEYAKANHPAEYKDGQKQASAHCAVIKAANKKYLDHAKENNLSVIPKHIRYHLSSGDINRTARINVLELSGRKHGRDEEDDEYDARGRGSDDDREYEGYDPLGDDDGDGGSSGDDSSSDGNGGGDDDRDDPDRPITLREVVREFRNAMEQRPTVASTPAAAASSSSSSTTPNRYVSTKLDPYDGDPNTTPPRIYLHRFQVWAESQGLSWDQRPSQFINHNKDPSMLKILVAVRIRSDPREYLAALTNEFLIYYSPSKSVITARQMKMRELKKAADEPIMTYLDRWIKAYDAAHPADDAHISSSRNSMFIDSLEKDVRDTIHRSVALGSGTDPMTLPWAELRSMMEGIYETRPAQVSFDAGMYQIERQKLEEKLGHLSSSHHYPLDRSDWRSGRNQTHGDPFINPTVSSSSKHRIQEYVTATSRLNAVMSGDDRPTRAKNKSNNKRRRQQNRDVNVVMMDTSASGESDSSSGSEQQKKKKKVSNYRQPNPQGLPRDSQGRVMYGPCKGHTNACGRMGHSWDYCPRNPNGKRPRPSTFGQTGPAPEFDASRFKSSNNANAKHENSSKKDDQSKKNPNVNVINEINRVVGKRGVPDLYVIDATVNTVMTDNALLDTGADISLLSEDLFMRLPFESRKRFVGSNTTITTANGASVDVLGKLPVRIVLRDKTCDKYYAVDKTIQVMGGMSHDLIIGQDLLPAFLRNIDVQTGHLEFASTQECDPVGNLIHFMPSNDHNESPLYVYKGAIIGKNQMQYVRVAFDPEMLRGRPSATVMCEPTVTYTSKGTPIPIKFPPHLCNTHMNGPGKFTLLIHNPSSHSLSLRPGTRIGLATIVDRAYANSIEMQEVPQGSEETIMDQFIRQESERESKQ